MKLQVVGGGNMGMALVGGVLANGWAEAGEIGVVELDEQRREQIVEEFPGCLLYTSPSPRDLSTSRMPSSA